MAQIHRTVTSLRLLLILMLIPYCGFSQSKEYVFKGLEVLKSAQSCKYELVFTVTGTIVKGYSVSYVQEGMQTKTEIEGVMNVKQRSISFSEMLIPVNTPDDMSICFIKGKMSFKHHMGHDLFIGKFTGKDYKGKNCGDGVIVFEAPPGSKNVFDIPAAKPIVVRNTKPATSLHKKAMKHAEPEPDIQFTKIATGDHNELAWKTDSFVIEVWDGGFVDGDIVSVQFNGQKVLSNVTLTGSKNRIALPMPLKTNTVIITAENEGVAIPNTAQIIIYDGKTRHGLLACLKKGTSTSLTLNKK